ncbi:hypothetical protein [Actinoplanes sp. NPDC049681]|uniref:hypothetical protein n=1 Tax=Actinoplanes sp. NPDC049681 TaxID=3363905 RepID=UPI003795A754
MNDIESRLVKPFYLDMMGLNALRLTHELPARLTTAGHGITPSDVSWMLRTGPWRPVVMGAWFSLALPTESVQGDLLEAMAQSRGSLTAPPLAAAAAVVIGPAAVPSMLNYLDYIMAPALRDGSEDVVAVAVKQLGGEPPLIPTDEGRRAFQGLHAFAMRLHEAWRVH